VVFTEGLYFIVTTPAWLYERLQLFKCQVASVAGVQCERLATVEYRVLRITIISMSGTTKKLVLKTSHMKPSNWGGGGGGLLL